MRNPFKRPSDEVVDVEEATYPPDTFVHDDGTPFDREEWIEAQMELQRARIGRAAAYLAQEESVLSELLFLSENPGMYGFGDIVVPEQHRHSSVQAEALHARKRPWN